MEKLDVDEERRRHPDRGGFLLARGGGLRAAHEMLEIEAFDEDTVNELRNRARNVLLTEAIVTEEQLEEVADDLLGLEGMDKSLAAKLAQRHQDPRRPGRPGGRRTVEMTGIDAQRAKQLITTARAHWFE
jgi:N utilization substance protein A